MFSAVRRAIRGGCGKRGSASNAAVTMLGSDGRCGANIAALFKQSHSNVTAPSTNVMSYDTTLSQITIPSKSSAESGRLLDKLLQGRLPGFTTHNRTMMSTTVGSPHHHGDAQWAIVNGIILWSGANWLPVEILERHSQYLENFLSRHLSLIARTNLPQGWTKFVVCKVRAAQGWPQYTVVGHSAAIHGGR